MNMENSRKVVAVVDYENVMRYAVEKGGIVDFIKLNEMILEIGEIIFGFVFVPLNYVNNLHPDINNCGFEIILCQKQKKDESDKIEDTVDIHIIQLLEEFKNFKEITDFVIVGDDGHMINISKKIKNRKKDVTFIGSHNISSIIKRIIGRYEDIPLK